MYKVYPRPRGGAVEKVGLSAWECGLSPPARGSPCARKYMDRDFKDGLSPPARGSLTKVQPILAKATSWMSRSIPARAGEPI